MAVQLRIQLKGDTAENWASKNTILLKNELGYDSTTNRIKFGNGVTAWNDLPYVAPDVINDLITGGTTAALSAEQGKILKTLLDTKADSSEVQDLISQVQNSITTINEQIENSTGQTDEKINEKLDASKITHETWSFTLEDESVVDKEVVLWNS